MSTRLLENCPKVKIVDFGFARKLNSKSHDPVEKYSQFYISPETVERMKHNAPYNDEEGLASDVFTLGVLLYKLTFREFPYREYHRRCDKLTPNFSPFESHMNRRSATKDLRALLKDLLRENVNDRINICGIESSKWMSSHRYFPSEEAPLQFSEEVPLQFQYLPADNFDQNIWNSQEQYRSEDLYPYSLSIPCESEEIIENFQSSVKKRILNDSSVNSEKENSQPRYKKVRCHPAS